MVLILAQIFGADWITEMVKHVPVLVVRTIVSFLVVMMTVRWTGKRSIANLAPFDLAMVIMIGEVAAIPVSDLDVDFLHGILPVLLIGGLHVAMTFTNLHWKSFERLTEGYPTLLVKDGRILKQNLVRERVSMSDLLTALRHKDVEEVTEVKEAWIEHAGGISVILKHEADAATPRDVERAVERVLALRLEGAVASAVERSLGAAADRAVAEAVMRPLASAGDRAAVGPSFPEGEPAAPAAHWAAEAIHEQQGDRPGG